MPPWRRRRRLLLLVAATTPGSTRRARHGTHDVPSRTRKPTLDQSMVLTGGGGKEAMATDQARPGSQLGGETEPCVLGILVVTRTMNDETGLTKRSTDGPLRRGRQFLTKAPPTPASEPVHGRRRIPVIPRESSTDPRHSQGVVEPWRVRKRRPGTAFARACTYSYIHTSYIIACLPGLCRAYRKYWVLAVSDFRC